MDVCREEDLVTCLVIDDEGAQYELCSTFSGQFEPDFEYLKNKVIYGAISGQPLDTKKVVTGRGVEVHRMQELNVYHLISIADAKRLGYKIVSSRWLDDNKGEMVRSRLVAQEVSYFENREDCNASTPGLKACRLILSLAASKPSRPSVQAKNRTRGSTGKTYAERRRQLALHDVSVAFFHADMDELVAVRPPKGTTWVPEGMLMALDKAMYGTRKASQLWQELVATTLCKDELFLRSPTNGSLYHSEELDVETCIHGDDFLSEGDPEDLDALDSLLTKSFITKVLERVGPGAGREGRYLNRHLTWCVEGFDWEADRKHVPLMLEELGLLECKPSATPGDKLTG